MTDLPVDIEGNEIEVNDVIWMPHQMRARRSPTIVKRVVLEVLPPKDNIKRFRLKVSKIGLLDEWERAGIVNYPERCLIHKESK